MRVYGARKRRKNVTMPDHAGDVLRRVWEIRAGARKLKILRYRE
jgi:hypothetical protein